MYNFKLKQSLLIVLAAIAILFFLFVVLSGCGSSKKVVQVNRSTVDSVSKRTMDSTVRETEKKLELKYFEDLKVMSEELKRQYEAGVVFGEPCDTVRINTVEIRPDGTVKATGNIKNTNVKLSDIQKRIESIWQKKVDSITEEKELEVNKRITAEDELKKTSVVKSVEKKKSSWLFWFCLGFGTCLVLAVFIKFRKKLFPKLKL